MKHRKLTKNRHHSQAGSRRGAPRVSLFPFLAVLICTMGALMLLLLFVSRQARLQAAREAAAKIAKQQSSIATETDVVQWRVEQLKTAQQATVADLARARLVLGHVEDHTRRLQAQLQVLQAEAQKAQAQGLQAGHFAVPGEDELRQLQGQVAAAEHRLANAQRSAANRPKSYAIVPYEGPNCTRRRPIYIECRSDGVVLQPDNIVFDESDFDEPLGPGNPLATAVRAARQQMLLDRSPEHQKEGEPYPLLLVRPDGAAAYVCALAALKASGEEFGYEMVDADWDLKFPPPDAALNRTVAAAVGQARQEHARLIAAAPFKYGKQAGAGAFRSSGGGGAGHGDGGSPGFYASKPDDRYAQNSAAGGNGTGGGNGLGSGNGSGSGSGNGLGSGSGHGNGSGHGSGSGSHSGGDDDDSSGGDSNLDARADAEFAANDPYASLGATGGPASGRGGGGAPGGYGGSPGGYGGSTGGYGGSPGGYGGAPGGYGGSPGGGGGSFAGTGGAGGSTPSFAAAGGAGANGAGGMPGMGGSSDGGGPGGAGGGAAGPAGMASSGMPSIYTPMFGQSGGTASAASGSAASGMPANGQVAGQAYGTTGGTASAAAMQRPDGYIIGQPQDNTNNAQPPRNRPSGVAMVPAGPLLPGEWRPADNTPPPKPDPNDKKKKHPYDDLELDHSENEWALRDAGRHAAAFSRPVHLECYPDRLVILPEQGVGEPRVVPLEGDAQRNADRLVGAVWEIIDSWGIAGQGMYWKPILSVRVAPGAEPRMNDLTRALNGSGLVIERR